MPLNGDEPRETASVVEEVIKEIEAGGGGDESVRESTDTETKTADTKVVEDKKSEAKPDEKKSEAKVEDDDDDFEKVPAEIDDPNPRNKGKKVENKLPHSRVKRMVEKARKAAREAADGEWKAKHEPLEQNFNAVVADIRRLDQLAMTDTDAFLAELAKANPVYKEYVRQKAAEAKEEAKAAEDPEPQPDVPNDKGEMVGFSIPQAKKLIQWVARQEVKGVKKDLEPTVEAVRTAQKTEAERRRQEEEDKVYADAAASQLEDAKKNWPGYNEHEKEIQEAFHANKHFRLYDAYIHVVVPKLQKAATDARTSVLEELKKQPVDTSVGTSHAAREEEATKPMSTEEIARQVIREAEAAAR